MKQPWYRRWFPKEEPPKVALFPHLAPHERECPKCKRVVTHWMTFTTGTILCVFCHQAPKPPAKVKK
jgi:hypothetical protein